LAHLGALGALGERGLGKIGNVFLLLLVVLLLIVLLLVLVVFLLVVFLLLVLLLLVLLLFVLAAHEQVDLVAPLELQAARQLVARRHPLLELALVGVAARVGFLRLLVLVPAF